MAVRDEIQAAVGAHGLWKGRLKQAIHTGASDASLQSVRADNTCKFGQWLYGTSIPATARSSSHYRECVDLHAKFHTAAATVLELALAGKKAEAEAALEPGSQFAIASRSLTEAMMRWQNAA